MLGSILTSSHDIPLATSMAQVSQAAFTLLDSRMIDSRDRAECGVRSDVDLG